GLALVTTFTDFGGGEPDFAKIGYNNDAVVIMADNFTSGFGGNLVYIAIDKSQLLQGNLVDFQYSFNDFSTDFDAEPARMRGDTTVGGPIYLVEQSNGAPFINP